MGQLSRSRCPWLQIMGQNQEPAMDCWYSNLETCGSRCFFVSFDPDQIRVLTRSHMFSDVFTSNFCVHRFSYVQMIPIPHDSPFFATKSTAMHRFLQRSRRPYQVFMARNPGTSAGGPRPRPEVKVELGSKKEVTNSQEIDRYSNTLYAPCMVCLPTWLDDTGYWVHC